MSSLVVNFSHTPNKPLVAESISLSSKRRKGERKGIFEKEPL